MRLHFSIVVVLICALFTDASLFDPISTDAPPAALQTIKHPLVLDRLRAELVGKPLQTNKYWVNFMVVNGSSPVHSHPFVLLANEESPYGVRISHPEMEVCASCLELFELVHRNHEPVCVQDLEYGGGYADRVQYYGNKLNTHIGVSATEFTQPVFPELQSFGTFGAVVQMRK
jgi:hypothetical protein